MQLVLNTNGLMVKKRNNNFWIVHKKGKRMISPNKVSSIAVTSDCFLSASAIRLAVAHGIPILFFNARGKAEARLWSPSFGRMAALRRKQVLFEKSPEATAWVIRLFQLKMDAQRSVLGFVLNRKPETAVVIRDVMEYLIVVPDKMAKHKKAAVKSVQANLMGIEGAAAKQYWMAMSQAVKGVWAFNIRSRRPSTDPFNAALNYLYGMLYSAVESALFAHGLDPYLGILHSDEYNKPVLTFDVIEPFRPWMDQLLLQLVFDNKMSAVHFAVKADAVTVNSKGKQILIPAFNECMAGRCRFEMHENSRVNHLYVFAGKLVESLNRTYL